MLSKSRRTEKVRVSKLFVFVAITCFVGLIAVAIKEATNSMLFSIAIILLTIFAWWIGGAVGKNGAFKNEGSNPEKPNEESREVGGKK